MKASLFAIAPLALVGVANAQLVGSWTNSGAGCLPVPSLVAGKTDIGAALDTVNGPHALGFSFPYVGGVGTTTSIDIAPNGYIYLEASTNSDPRLRGLTGAGGAPNANFLSATPSIACFGQNLNASDTSTGGHGDVYFGTNNVDTACIVWGCVGEHGNWGARNTFVCTMYISGTVSIEHHECALLSHHGLVGYSPGNAATDPGTQDLSAGLATGVTGDAVYEAFAVGTFDLSASSTLIIPDFGTQTVSIFSGGPISPAPCVEPLMIDSPGMPTTGLTTSIVFTNIPANAIATSALLGAAPAGSLPLDIIGMEGCVLESTLDIAAIPVVGNVVSIPVSANTMVGLTLYIQGASIASGVNTFGIALSNLGTMTIGDTIPSRFESIGANSYNNDTSFGFWSLTNGNTLDIIRLTVDFHATLSGRAFDTDQGNMGDRFDAGLAGGAGCTNTYRNGSDATTGLVYAGTSLGAGCLNVETGCRFSNRALGSTWETLTFDFIDFNPGEVFEWTATPISTSWWPTVSWS